MERTLNILVDTENDDWIIPVSVEFTNGTHQTIEDGLITYCDHMNVEIEKACCSSPDADTGYYSCGCYGMDSRYCDDCKRYVDEDGNWV